MVVKNNIKRTQIHDLQYISIFFENKKSSKSVV